MESGAGGFADGVEIGDIGGSVEGGLDASDLVVCGWVNGDGVCCWVDAEGVEGCPDAWESCFEVFEMPAIEPDMFSALDGELLDDGS